MKSFTVTFHQTCNYGATLQAYALQQVLNDLGTENTVLDYMTFDTVRNEKSLKNKMIKIILGFLRFFRQKKLDRLVASFREFRKNYLTLSKKYHSMQDLRDDPPDADILVTGSDQVWNIKTNPEFVPARFLDFGKPDAIRFSYAASIGLCDYSDSEKEKIASYLERFKGVSLREKTSADYVSGFVNKECHTVCDPVILLDKSKWQSIARQREITQKPYILCYCVQKNNRLSETVKKLKKRTGYKVISINCGPITRCRADYNLFDVSPQEFLWLYQEAAIVVTTSFHGTAFALKFGKPVYALVSRKKDTRITDLMNYVGLSEYIIRNDTVIPEIPSDMNFVEEKLQDYRQQSLQYIKRMINYPL